MLSHHTPTLPLSRPLPGAGYDRLMHPVIAELVWPNDYLVVTAIAIIVVFIAGVLRR